MATGTSRWSLGWDDISPEALRRLDPGEFEGLCSELISLESKDRHSEDHVFEGPPAKYSPGKDLGLRIKSPPRKSRADFRAEWNVAPLTGDPVAYTVFSCKTGANWQKTVLDEARHGSPWALDALHGGGYFVVLVNLPVDRGPTSPGKKTAKKNQKKQPAKSTLKTKGASTSIQTSSAPSETFTAQLEEIYGDRMRTMTPGTSNPIDRIRLIDANDLNDYLRCRRPNELSLALRNKLGAAPIPGLLMLDQWRIYHDRDRGTPLFVLDPKRTIIQNQLRSLLTADTDDPYGRVAWLVGAPGVGKTRLVVETLRSDTLLRKRALVAPSFEEAVAAARDYGLYDRYPTAILIVDDCPPEGLDALMPWLASTNHHAKGGLVVLTPMAPEWSRGEKTRYALNRIELDPMDETSLEALITRELGNVANSINVTLVARLAEGFPWYAILVAKEIRLGAAPPTTAAEAAKLALCSRDGLSDDNREDEILLRARALLVAMLTENVAWSSLTTEDREDLCRAVGLNHWTEVETATRKCNKRGLLRIRLKDAYRYVTPAVLEREVARMLLDPPDGTEPRGPDLERYARRFLPRFYERLQQLGFDVTILSQLALPIVRALEAAPPGLAVLGRGGVSGAALRFAARYQPKAVAHLLRIRIEETSLDELRSRADLRRDLIFALQSLAGRRSSFQEAEAALFRLAVAENEAFANNATGLWASLFLIELNATYQRFEEKLPLLRAHCMTGDSGSRLVALKGLAAAISTHSWNMAGEEIDGAYPRLTYAEARHARLAAWTLLTECASDPDPTVASKARDIMTHEIPGATRTALVGDVARLLIPLIQHFDEIGLRKLRDAISISDERNAQHIKQAGASDDWSALLEAAKAQSFSERLRQRVGSWSRAAHREAEKYDSALAQEGLSLPDRPVLLELDWLSSTDAVRSTPFSIALGKADNEGILLERLLGRAKAGHPDLVTAYLRGFQLAGREAEVDVLLRRLHKEEAFAETVALAVWRLGATDERLRFVVEDLRAGRLPDRILSMFTLGSWEKAASDDTLAELLEALLDRNSTQATEIALNLVAHRIKEQESSAMRWKDLLARALKHAATSKLAGMVAYDWEMGAKELISLGDVAIVTELAVSALSTEDDELGNDEVWSVLRECAKKDPERTWKQVAERLVVNGRSAWLLAMGMSQHGILSSLLLPDILTWVDRNEHRAHLVAAMVPMHDGLGLPDIAHALIDRFGPDAPCSGMLATQLESTPQAVSSLADFVNEQLVRARQWTTDASPRVRAWADALVDELERTHELHAAREEYESRRWGT